MLWSDEKINDVSEYGNNLVDPGFRYINSLIASDMRDDYELAITYRDNTIIAQAAEIERLKATRELVGATRINNNLTAARIRTSQLEAALAGCAGQWTPVQDMAEFCSCEEDYCAASWRVENGGSRLVVGNGEEELSVELPGNMRMCWQISEAANG